MHKHNNAVPFTLLVPPIKKAAIRLYTGTAPPQEVPTATIGTTSVALTNVRAMMLAGTRESGGIDWYHLQLFHLLLPLRFRFEASLLRGIARRPLGL